MNELVITPNFEKKSAKIRGRCAAGEHVLVRLVDMAGLPAETLRLCIMLRERLFAVFPLAIEDSAAEWTVDGGDLTCVLNLNTEPLVKFARCGALTLEFILDDPSNHILYFSEMHQVQPWHSLRASGDDAQPRDMPPFDGVVISTKTLADLREAVRRLAERGGAKIISSVAIALLAFSGAFAATVQTVPLNDLDFDANPSIVTNVTFDPAPDFSTNNTALVDTIVATSPAPGNYAAVSNRAMTALQSYTETDPTVPAWAKAETQPLPPNYSTISNKAMTALQSFTETDPTISSWAKAATKPSYAWNEIASKPTFATIATSGSYNDLSNKPTIPTTAADVGALSTNGGTLNGGITVRGDSTFYGNVFSFSDSFKIKFMDAIAPPYFEIFGSDVNLPLGGGTLALTSDIPTTMAWSAITGKPSWIGNSKPSYTASEVGAIPTTGGVFNASLHLNQKLSVGTWTSSVKPYDISGGSGIAFVFGDNVQTKQSNTMTLGVGALNTNAWSFIWNGDADRMYIPGFPAMSNPYATRHNGGFHVNPSVRSGMVNPLQNFWIGDTNLNDWISALAPTPTWDTLSGKPTTISGYGITDALKSDFASLTNNAAFTSAVAAVSPPTDTSELEARGFVRIVADDEIYFVTITTTQTEE